ncbi:Isopentenyl-diphosphate delta-isomerase [uncultured archaeon]|nr:Isopentenyl-diphosphate delta-isomerase [uncultured archaeon]
MTTSDRKIEHLLLCVEKDVEAHRSHTGLRACGFDDLELVHNCLPEINKKNLNLETEFLGKKLRSPFLIASMTGGHPDTKFVNATLASAAEELGIGIGVGSQRAAIEDPSMEDSFRVARDKAPTAFIYGNVGAAQLGEFGIEGLERAVEMIGADAMAIHLNFLQEAIQPEGNIDASGCLAAIKKICTELSVPVIVKETGAGIARSQAIAICDAGAAAIDVGGLVGTSWAGVETYRAQKRGDLLSEHLGKEFWNWGIPTAVSIVESTISIPVIATGGIRSGIDAAKSIALGASMCGIALPLVAPALKGQKDVVDKLAMIIEELKVAMFLSGCQNVEELGNAPVVITGRTREFLEQRGFETVKFARKRYKM